MKTIGLMQPYLFPYLGYFQLIRAVDEYVIYDDAQFIKQGWINRNNILISRQATLFSIRLAGASSNKAINEIDILDDFSNFLQTIGMVYSKAPYKEQVMALLQTICANPDKNLARFIGNSLREICNYLGIETKLLYSSSVPKNNELKGQDKVIAICKALNADTYINAIGGQELYDRDAFSENGIELRFIKMKDIQYKQFGNDFIPNLSIIDVMMFNDPRDIKQMLEAYELI